MKKILRMIFVFALMLPLWASAQDIRSLRKTSDSIINAYYDGMEKVGYQFTQLVNSPTDFFTDDTNELTGDTIWLENYETFKFYRTKRQGDLFLAEYYVGKVGTVFEKEVVRYFFKDSSLQMTQYQFLRHGDALDDNVTNIYLEEKRLIFNGGQFPMYIFRDAEGLSDELRVSEIPFQQIDVRKIIYDKYMYETVGQKILNGKTDI